MYDWNSRVDLLAGSDGGDVRRGWSRGLLGSGRGRGRVPPDEGLLHHGPKSGAFQLVGLLGLFLFASFVLEVLPADSLGPVEHFPGSSHPFLLDLVLLALSGLSVARAEVGKDTLVLLGVLQNALVEELLRLFAPRGTLGASVEVARARGVERRADRRGGDRRDSGGGARDGRFGARGINDLQYARYRLRMGFLFHLC